MHLCEGQHLQLLLTVILEHSHKCHAQGKMFGLTFKENWYVTGVSAEPEQEFVFVQYKGHTLQGSYAGGFVYARTPQLPQAALPQVQTLARQQVTALTSMRWAVSEIRHACANALGVLPPH